MNTGVYQELSSVIGKKFFEKNVNQVFVNHTKMYVSFYNIGPPHPMRGQVYSFTIIHEHTMNNIFSLFIVYGILSFTNCIASFLLKRYVFSPIQQTLFQKELYELKD